jgi:uncharacterized protein YyaL (SSP411 family)
MSGKLFFCITIVLLSCYNFTVAQGIEFQNGTWEDVLQKAKKENKPVFVDAYTTWCGPCKWMSKNTFTQKEVGDYINNNFIAFKMDMEKGEGPEFAKINKVVAYPTMLFFSPKGDMIHKGVGARDAKQLLSLCNDAMNPDKQLTGYIKKYESGIRDKDFLYDYITVLSGIGDDFSDTFDEYWEILSDDEKQTEKVLKLMAAASNYFNDFKSPLFQYLLKFKAEYINASSIELVNDFFNSCYVRSLYGIARKTDKKEQKKLSKELLEIFPEKKKEFVKRLAYMKSALQTPPDINKITKTQSAYLKISSDANELNDAAWRIYESEDDPDRVKEALGWVNRSIEIKPSFNNLDTKAALLFKMRDYESAKVFAEKALKAAKDEGYENQPEDTVKLLENINMKLGKQ